MISIVFNANGASESMAKTGPGETLSYPYLKFAGITEEELFLKGAYQGVPQGLIFERLYTLARNPQLSNSYEFSDFLHEFSTFAHRLVPTEAFKNNPLISAQKAGNCPVKTFRCFMLEQIGNKEDYKRADLDLRFVAILLSYAKWNKTPSSKDAFMLQQALMRFLHQIDEHRRLLGEAPYFTAIATAREMLQQINAYLNKKSTAKQIPSHRINHKEAAERREFLKNYKPAYPSQQLSSSNVDRQFYLLDKGGSWETLPGVLTEMQKLSIEESKNWLLQYEILLGNSRPLKHRPLPQKLCDPVAIEKILKSLQTCFAFYLGQVGIPSPSQQNVIMETVALFYCLAVQADLLRKTERNAGVLKEYGIDDGIYRMLSQFPLFHINEVRVLEHRNELLHFFSSHGKQKLFRFFGQPCTSNDILQGNYPEARYHLETRNALKPPSNLSSMTPIQAELAVRKDIQQLRKLCAQTKTAKDTAAKDDFSHFYRLKTAMLWSTEALLKCAIKDPDKSMPYVNWVDEKQTSKIEGFESLDTDRKKLRLKFSGLTRTWGMVLINTSDFNEKDVKEGYGTQGPLYLRSSLSKHDRSKLPTENARQTQLSIDKNQEKDFPAWSSALCVAGAEASVLLQELTRQFKTLTLQELNLFSLFFYKTIDTPTSTTSPLFQQMRDQPQFLEQLMRLGKEAFGLWKNNPEKREHLQFILKFQANLLQQYQDAQKAITSQNLELSASAFQIIRKQCAYLQKMANAPQLEKQTQLTNLAIQAALLLTVPFHQLSIKEKSSLFLSLVHLHQAQTTYHWIMPPERAFVFERCLLLKAQWQELIKTQGRELAEETLKRVDASTSIQKLSYDPENLKIRILDHYNKQWEIDLALCQFKKGKNGVLDDIFQDDSLGIDVIRGHLLHHFEITLPPHPQISAGCIQFEDPVWGPIRAYPAFMHVQKNIIERFFEGHWHTWVPDDEMPWNSHLNDALLNKKGIWAEDRALWINLTTKDLVITDFKAKKLYKTNAEGELLSAEGQKIFSKSAYPDALSRFAPPEQICSWKDEKNNWYYELPQFTPKLAFHSENAAHRRLRYQGNPTYYVDETPHQPDWGVGSFLNLCAEDKTDRLVLIPEREINSTGFTPSCTLRDSVCHSYFEYAVEGDTLQPKTLNGRVYLAALYLAQKKYQKALSMIKGISLSDIPNANTLRHLKEIVPEEGFASDLSPKANAVRLHACLRIREIASSRDTEEFINFNNAKLELCYECYLRTPKIRETKLGLSKEDEALIKELSFKNAALYTSTTSYTGSVNIQPLALNVRDILKHVIRDPYSHDSSWEDSQLMKSLSTCYTATQEPAFQKLYKTIWNCSDKNTLVQYAYRICHDKNLTTTPLGNSLLLFFIQRKLEHSGFVITKEIPQKEKSLQDWCKRLIGPESFSSRSSHANETLLKFRYPDILKKPTIHQNPPRKQQHSPPAEAAKPTLPCKDPSYDDYLVQTAKKDTAEDTIEATAKKSTRKTPADAAKPFPAAPHKEHYENARKAAKIIAAHAPRLKNGISRKTITTQLNNDIAPCKAQEALLETHIKALVNRPFNNPLQNTHHFVHTKGSGKEEISIEMVCRAATSLKNAMSRLSKLNPALSKEELDDLRSSAFTLMALQTQRRHLEKILERINKDCSDPELAELLAMKRQYEPAQDPFFLFFEWISGMRVKKKQKKLIDAAKNKKNFVFQLMMAGGKSSVIFSALIETVSNCTNFVPCMVAHHSQYPATLANLKKFQGHRFKKDLIPLDATFKELGDLKVVERLIRRFEKARRKGCPILMRSSFPLMLKLQLNCAAAAAVQEERGVISEHLKRLNHLLKLLQKDSIFFLDEIDSSLSMKVDVRTPHGESFPFPADEAELLADVYKKLDSKELRDITGIYLNQQEKVSPDAYIADILPTLAAELFDNPALKLQDHPKFKDAFVRYMTDQILDKNKNEPDNAAFLAFLQSRWKMKKTPERRAVELLGSMRNFLKKVLHHALSRSYFRHYGPRLDKTDEGEIVPYQGVGEPSPNKFGNPHFAFALHLQACLCQKISSNEIAFLGEKMLEAAKFYADAEKKELTETLEAQQFYALTGISLTKTKDAAALEKAVQYVNDPNHSYRKLLVRKEVAPFHIQVHPFEAYETAIDLPAIPEEGDIGGSGTLPNHPSFNIALGAPQLDTDAEGRVLNHILENGKLESIKDKSLTYLLAMMDAQPPETKKQMAGLIDIGGFLKSEPSTNAAAQKLQTHFRKHQDYQKDAIVYLHKFSPHDERFVLLRKDAEEPILLENITKEELLKHKIPLERIFFLWDELRTTGTDFFLPGTPESPMLCYATIDPKMSIRNLLQGSMRCRGYLEGLQNVRFIFSEKEKNLFLNNAATIQDVADTMILCEEKSVQTDVLRSFQEQLRSLVKQEGFAAIQSAIEGDNSAKLCQAVQKYSPYLTPKTSYFNYKAWLGIDKEVPTQTFFENVLADELAGNATRKTLLSSIAHNPYLPQNLLSSKTDNFVDQELHIECDYKVEMALENFNEELKELELELENELAHYQAKGALDFKEEAWTNWTSPLPPNIFSVQALLNGDQGSSKFAACFPSNIWVTNNLRNTYANKKTHVFDYRFKPTHFALIVQNPRGGLDTILLSKHDKEELQKLLTAAPKENTWLINLQGFEEMRHPSPLPSPEKLAKPLWYANFFNGNTDHILENKALTHELTDKKQNPHFGRYLLFKNAKNSQRLIEVLISGLIITKTFHKTGQKHLFSWRRKTLNIPCSPPKAVDKPTPVQKTFLTSTEPPKTNTRRVYTFITNWRNERAVRSLALGARFVAGAVYTLLTLVCAVEMVVRFIWVAVLTVVQLCKYLSRRGAFENSALTAARSRRTMAKETFRASCIALWHNLTKRSVAAPKPVVLNRPIRPLPTKSYSIPQGR